MSILALEGNSKVLPFVIFHSGDSSDLLPLHFACSAYQVQVNKSLVVADHCKPWSLFSICHDLKYHTCDSAHKKYFCTQSQVQPLNKPNWNMLTASAAKAQKSSSCLSVPHLLPEFLWQNTIPQSMHLNLFLFTFLYLPNRKKLRRDGPSWNLAQSVAFYT